jgi:hypothetical protein
MGEVYPHQAPRGSSSTASRPVRSAVGLAAPEVGLKLDDGHAAQAGEATKGVGQQ